MATGVTVRAFVFSSFALDGGAMHGIVPRPLWERAHVPDARNRIPLVARALLVDCEKSGARVLIELGMGQRWTEKERGIYALEGHAEPPEILERAGVDPGSITHVVLTHAHWDHAGGVVRAADASELMFPRAEHVLGEKCLAHARSASEKDAGSFRSDDIETLLARAPKLRLFREGDELAPGLTARLSNGHTEGLVIPIIPERDDGPPLAVPTDLIPTRSHLKPSWGMAYDNFPLTVAREKRELIEELARIGGGVLLYHDPLVEAAWAISTPSGPALAPGLLDGSRAP
jgi:glyoxylase-like metal-dependent hydrolase (beta-lactamase superfamily II)